MKHVKLIGRAVFTVIALTGFSGVSYAAAFQPVIDEFWITKNGSQIFRDSFDDGVPPQSGPDGANTYIVGASDGGFAGGESGGKLTMTPSLGTRTLITGSTADTFTGAIRQRSIDPASGDFLGFTDSFTIGVMSIGLCFCSI